MMDAASNTRPQGWDLWRTWWDERRQAGMNGDGFGADGSLRRGTLAAIAFMALADTMNVLTALHDAARHGRTLAFWEPATWEATSALGVLAACPIAYAALLIARPGILPWWRTALVHGAASVAFSLLHVALMMAARIAIYGALGYRYRLDPGFWLYEYRKDLIGYLVIAGLFYLLGRTPQHPATTAQPTTPPPTKAPRAPALRPAVPSFGARPPNATFSITDGAQTLRIPAAAILAVRSAGNYAEFWLEDGRRPLMRATLRALEEELAPLGFIQTHRSWLANTTRVEALTSSGSGDFTLTLPNNIAIPLSRRFPAALQQLRSKQGLLF